MSRNGLNNKGGHPPGKPNGRKLKRRRGWRSQAEIDAVEPAQDPRLGELTPEWIRWYGLNHTPQEFQAKYARLKYRVPPELHHFCIH